MYIKAAAPRISEVPRQTTRMLDALEEQFQRVLHLPLVTRCTGVGAEVRRGKRVGEPGQIGMIKDVIDLPTKLQVHLLGDLRVLKETRIVVPEVRQTQGVARARADIAEKWLRQWEVTCVHAGSG